MTRRYTLTRLAIFALAMLAWSPALLAQTGKVASIQVTGSKRFLEPTIAAASGLHLGDQVGREEIQAAANRLAKLGPFSKVEFRFSSKGEDVRVEFRVEDAPTVPVSFDNFPWFTDAELTEALKEAVVLFDGTAPEQGPILDAMTEALEKLLHSRGVNATVEHILLAQPASEGMMQQFHVVGASLKVGAIEFQDALANQDKRIHDRLSDLVGKPYSRYAVEVFSAEQVRPVYLEGGYLRVRFGAPRVRFAGDPNKPLPDSVLVIVPIEPGPAYRWGGTTWSGNTLFSSAILDAFLGLQVNEPANGLKIAVAWERVRAEYGRRGYLDTKIEPVPVFNDATPPAAPTVSYRAAVTEGPQYHMGELVITGLSLAAEKQLRAAWRIAPGEIFDRVYFNDLVENGIKRLFTDSPVHFNEIGHLLRADPEAKKVDALLDFH